MLQQVLHLARSAPLDGGLVAGEGLDAAGGGAPAGGDFLALLAQAEGRDGVSSAGDAAPGGSAADQGVACLPAGLATDFSPAMSAPTRQAEPPGTHRQDGDDASDGIMLAGDMKGDGGAGLVASVATGPGNAASPPSMIALQGAVSALPIAREGLALPATGVAQSASPSPALLLHEEVPPLQQSAVASGLMQPATGAAHSASPSPALLRHEEVPPLHLSAVASGSMQPATGASPSAAPSPAPLPQEEVPPSRLPTVTSGLAAVGREAAPAARITLVAKVPSDDLAGGEQPAVTSAPDLDPFAPTQVAFQDRAEGSEPASVFRAEPGPSHPIGSTPSLMVSPALPEGRGLSMPADPSIAGAGSLPGSLAPGLSSPPVVTSLALPYQRLLHPQLSAQVAPAVLSMGVVPGTDGGPGRLTVAIRPAELGTLQIITERTEDGTARIAVLAERPETLQLLVRDAPTLEAALRAAGVDEGGGGLSLTFGLSSQGQGDRGGDARGGAGRAASRHDGADPKPAIIASGPAMARTSLLDLSL